MVAAFVLVAGVALITIIGAVVFVSMGMTKILVSLVPLAPWLIMVGTFLLMIPEFLLLFGDKEDRRSAKNDFLYLVPTLILSAVLTYIAQKYLW